MPARPEQLLLGRLGERLRQRLVVRALALEDQREHERDRVDGVVDPVQVGARRVPDAVLAHEPALPQHAGGSRRGAEELVGRPQVVVLHLVRDLERERDVEPGVARELPEQGEGAERQERVADEVDVLDVQLREDRHGVLQRVVEDVVLDDLDAVLAVVDRLHDGQREEQREPLEVAIRPLDLEEHDDAPGDQRQPEREPGDVRLEPRDRERQVRDQEGAEQVRRGHLVQRDPRVPGVRSQGDQRPPGRGRARSRRRRRGHTESYLLRKVIAARP